MFLFYPVCSSTGIFVQSSLMKRLFVTFTHILVFVWLIQVSTVPANAQYNPTDDQISLEEVWLSGLYFPDYASGFRWMQDDTYYTELTPGKGIARFSIDQEEKVDEIVLFSDLDLQGISQDDISDYQFGKDENFLVLEADVTPLYRHSTKSVVLAVDRAANKTMLLAEGNKVSHPTFSPDGTQLAYVFDNNLYVMEFPSGEVTQLTQDGETNAIINGMADWVYEEEFSYTKAFWWSPDGSYLAYVRFDESAVPEFSMPMYGELYPKLHTFKYPKAGEQNSQVTVHIYHLNNQGTIQVDIGEDTDMYIPRMSWISEDQLAVMRLNRLQNDLTLLAASPSDGSSEVILREQSDVYIEVSDLSWDFEKWHFLRESDDFLWISEMDGFYHIYSYNREGELVRDLTPGEYEVTSIVAVDEEQDRLYYLSAEEGSTERHLYSVTLKGKKKKRLTIEPGVHRISFSSATNYFVDDYSSATDPGKTLLRNADGEVIKELVTNDRLRTTMEQLNIADIELSTITTEEDVELNSWIIKPADFDESESYPVLMFCYGGPGSQEVLNSWQGINYLWFQMLAQQGYVVFCVDNRGTGGKGKAFRTSTYPNLGHLETIDQVAAAKWLQSQPWVDGDRIGIWGWSYGGYLTSLCMTKGGGIFNMGIAVAPVTNWRFYDTIYTERYLKTPQLNAEGYDDNSPINFANKLEGAYLLVHGTGDDNVHFQNSLEMVNALVAANKQFDSFFYPNRNHGIYGGYTRYHLYKKMTEFIQENL